MRSLYLATALAASLVSVNAQQGAWAQCGGIGWTGGTTCIAGYTCTYSNDWYSQCLPGSASSTSKSSSTSKTTSTPKTTSTSTSKASSSSSNSLSIHSTSTPVVPSTTTSQSPTGTNTAAQSTDSSVGKQIRTDQDPVYHLYIQDVNGAPVLGPEASSGYFVYGSTVALVMADGSKLYLNVDLTPSTSYKPVTLDTVAKTTNWSMSGDTFLVGGTQNFVVCPISGSTYWNFYLQTGNDMPSSACTNWITIHLPCLC